MELGQLAIVLVMFPLILPARRYSWAAFVQAAAAAVAGFVGLVWFFERVLAPAGAAWGSRGRVWRSAEPAREPMGGVPGLVHGRATGS
ncbi:hypothetical protein [Streptomyces sp. NPDC058739]|uniref:hypothetical protein n=1 Tax=Streptomyces sp. NPDC058739 TaxID=3346618 RepID=UPI0036D1F5B6